MHIPSSTEPEISCRISHTLLMYVREQNDGSLGDLLEGLDLDEAYLMDDNNWISHGFLQTLYQRMIRILDDEEAVYHMALATMRFGSYGILDRIARLTKDPKIGYSSIPKYSRMVRAKGDVFVITGPVFTPESPKIGQNGVRVPTYLFKLVYDQTTNRAWAHWQENREGERVGWPISYRELVQRTGVEFLPGLRL